MSDPRSTFDEVVAREMAEAEERRRERALAAGLPEPPPRTIVNREGKPR